MKFAKYWEKHDVDINHDLIIPNPNGLTSFWGGSNASKAEAAENAKRRAEKFKIFSKSDFQDTSAYAYTDSVFIGDIDASKTIGLVSRLSRFFGKPQPEFPPAVEDIKQFQKAHPEFTIEVYETSAGYRIFITNQFIASDSDKARTLFQSLPIDPLYVVLCKAQSCFRARLTPKPWRIDMPDPDRSCRFPRAPENESRHQQWLSSYQSKSKPFAVAKPIATFGQTPQHSELAVIMSIHDRYALQENSELA